MRLLVAIDSSAPSQQVVDEVARRPWPTATKVCVLHIVDLPQLAGSASLIQAAKQSASLLVESASTKIRQAGWEVTTKVFEGYPRTAIAEYATEWDADWVLVGSRGATGLARFLLGSVAQATLRRSPCSVEIVRRPAPFSATPSTGMRILIATDGSDCSMTAVRSVGERPWPVGSEIRVISVIPLVILAGEIISPALAPVPPPPDVAATLQTQARERAEEAIFRAREALKKAGTKAITSEFLPIGDARQAILDQARDWGADLIALGSHGRRGIDRLMLGSVAEAVATHAHCSVEVIRD